MVERGDLLLFKVFHTRRQQRGNRARPNSQDDTKGGDVFYIPRLSFFTGACDGAGGPLDLARASRSGKNAAARHSEPRGHILLFYGIFSGNTRKPFFYSWLKGGTVGKF